MLPKILITAGVHPEEEAGVLYLQRFNKHPEWKDGLAISVIPCRNTYGFFISECLNFDQIYMVCDSGELYYSNKRLLYVPSLSFMRNHRNQNVVDLICSSLSEKKYEGFLDVLSLRKSSRLHANSFYVCEGKLLDLNSRFSSVDKVFEFSTNNLLRTYNPNYFIDLHESRGKECFLYVSRNNPNAIAISRKIVTALISNNVPMRDSAKDRERIQTGVFALESFPDYRYCSNRGIVEIVFETGIDSSINLRLLWMQLFVNTFLHLLKTMDND